MARNGDNEIAAKKREIATKGIKGRKRTQRKKGKKALSL
jgi:hypothetical protein